MSDRHILIALVLLLGGLFGFLSSCDSPEEPTDHPRSSRSQATVESEPGEPTQFEEMTERPEPSSGEDVDYRHRRARVLRVFDGDSLKVYFPDNEEVAEVRIKGIDCPETSEEVDKCGPGGLVDLPCHEQIPLGIRAESYAKTLLEDKIITLESYNDFDRGGYGRILAYVRTPEGEDYGLKTVKKGYCNDSGRIYDHPRDDRYKLHQRKLRR